MSEELQPFKCRQCGSAMELVVEIRPVGTEPGLRAYECPNCHALAVEDVSAAPHVLQL